MSLPQHFRDSKIAQLDETRLDDENVVRFYVAVQDLAFVQILERERDLNQPIANLALKTVGCMMSTCQRRQSNERLLPL